MELIFVIIFFGLAMALFAALCAFTVKCFEFFFETRWSRFPAVFFTTMSAVLGGIAWVFLAKEKPKYRFNHTTGCPELISEGWGFSQKFGVFLALFWGGFISFMLYQFFK